MITTIFFDFDGVLTTDESGSYTTCKNMQCVLPEMSVDQILQCYRQYHLKLLLGHITHKEMWKNFCDCLGKNIEMSVLFQAFKKTPKNTDMFTICQHLKMKYRLGIITDNSRDRFKMVKATMNLTDTFDYFVVSADLGTRKDSAINFKKALKLADSQAKECIFIDNNISNLVVPKALGFNTIFHDHKTNDIDGLKRNLERLEVILH